MIKHRYWLAEHHAIAAICDPCPEVLAARLGAETRSAGDGPAAAGDGMRLENPVIASQRPRTAVGDPRRRRARLLELAERHAADERMIVTITGDDAPRARSYELLARAWSDQ